MFLICLYKYVYRLEHIWMPLRRLLPTLLQVLSDGEDMRLLADQVKGRGNYCCSGGERLRPVSVDVEIV